MGRLGHVGSYYAATANPAPERAELTGSLDCDVCVVGAGLAGCSAALHLAQAGLSVVLLEEHRAGWGASGRSGGQVIYGIAAGQRKLERLLGPGDARAAWEVSIEALALLRELVTRFSIDCDLANGHLLTAVKAPHVPQLQPQAPQPPQRLRSTNPHS